MKCPFCNKESTEVIESRPADDGSAIRRRRKCIKCDKRFTTYERVRNSFLWVIKKDGRRELFDREKVKKGILRAVEKRPVGLDAVEKIVDQVEREMLNKEGTEVTTRSIGGAVSRRLKVIDKVAWLRFASVYFEFDDLKDFTEAIKK